VGKPNERERERSYYSASGKYITAAKSHFQPREITYSTQTVPPKSASIFVPSPYCCTTLLENAAPRKSCQQPVVRLFCMAQQQQKLSSKTVPNPPQFLCPFLLLYGLYGSVQYGLQQQKNNSATKHKIFPWDLCPSSLGKRALFVAHFPLSSLLRKSLSIFSQCVLHTTQCILL
jgi:hypothetical protein